MLLKINFLPDLKRNLSHYIRLRVLFILLLYLASCGNTFLADNAPQTLKLGHGQGRSTQAPMLRSVGLSAKASVVWTCLFLGFVQNIKNKWVGLKRTRGDSGRGCVLTRPGPHRLQSVNTDGSLVRGPRRFPTHTNFFYVRQAYNAQIEGAFERICVWSPED